VKLSSYDIFIACFYERNERNEAEMGGKTGNTNSQFSTKAVVINFLYRFFVRESF